MAAALEQYLADPVSTASTSNTAYQDVLTVTVDRTGKSGTPDFYVFWSFLAKCSSAGSARGGQWRIVLDGSTVFKESGLMDDVTAGMPSQGVHKISALSVASHTIKIQHRAQNGSFSVSTEHASAAVLQKSANAQDAVVSTEQATGAATDWTTLHSLTFTPGTTEAYLVAFGCEQLFEDDGAGEGLRFLNETDSNTYYQEGTNEFISTRLDNIYRLNGGWAYETLENSSHKISIQGNGGGSLDEVKINNGTIVAIPLSDFENNYLDSSAIKTMHSGSDWSDSNASITQTVNAAPHLILGGAEVSSELVSAKGWGRMVSDSVNIGGDFGPEQRDEDADDYWFHGWVHGKELTAASKTFKIQGKPELDLAGRDAAINRVWLLVLEIPTGAAGVTAVASDLVIARSLAASKTAVAAAGRDTGPGAALADSRLAVISSGVERSSGLHAIAAKAGSVAAAAERSLGRNSAAARAASVAAASDLVVAPAGPAIHGGVIAAAVDAVLGPAAAASHLNTPGASSDVALSLAKVLFPAEGQVFASALDLVSGSALVQAFLRSIAASQDLAAGKTAGPAVIGARAAALGSAVGSGSTAVRSGVKASAIAAAAAPGSAVAKTSVRVASIDLSRSSAASAAKVLVFLQALDIASGISSVAFAIPLLPNKIFVFLDPSLSTAEFDEMLSQADLDDTVSLAELE